MRKSFTRVASASLTSRRGARIEGMITMRYLHTMVRVRDLDASLRFYCDLLGLEEVSRSASPQGRFTPVFFFAPGER